jgi:hypothetical protein
MATPMTPASGGAVQTPGYVAPGNLHQTLGRGRMPGVPALVAVRDPSGQSWDIPVSPTGHHPAETLERSAPRSSEWWQSMDVCRRLP